MTTLTFDQISVTPGIYKPVQFNCLLEVDATGVYFHPSQNLDATYLADDTWVNETFVPVS